VVEEQKKRKNVLTGGLILITLGVLIFLHQVTSFGFDKSWPILLIVIAAGTLIQRVKDVGGWLIGAIGILFFLVETWDINLHVVAVYLLPVLMILLGIFILRKYFQGDRDKDDRNFDA
jgi:hypothetical protein